MNPWTEWTTNRRQHDSKVTYSQLDQQGFWIEGKLHYVIDSKQEHQVNSNIPMILRISRRPWKYGQWKFKLLVPHCHKLSYPKYIQWFRRFNKTMIPKLKEVSDLKKVKNITDVKATRHSSQNHHHKPSNIKSSTIVLYISC